MIILFSPYLPPTARQQSNNHFYAVRARSRVGREFFQLFRFFSHIFASIARSKRYSCGRCPIIYAAIDRFGVHDRVHIIIIYCVRTPRGDDLFGNNALTSCVCFFFFFCETKCYICDGPIRNRCVGKRLECVRFTRM